MQSSGGGSLPLLGTDCPTIVTEQICLRLDGSDISFFVEDGTSGCVPDGCSEVSIRVLGLSALDGCSSEKADRVVHISVLDLSNSARPTLRLMSLEWHRSGSMGLGVSADSCEDDLVRPCRLKLPTLSFCLIVFTCKG